MKLYLLSENDFRLQFQEECAALEKEFFGTYKIGGGGIKNNGFDLDRFLNDQNIGAFADILLRVLTTNELTNDQTAKNVATVEAFTQYDEAKIKDFLIDNLIFNDPQKENELKVLFVVVYAALKEGYFYKVSAPLTDQLLGEWLSTRETGQLRINYNMTDFMPIGNQIHLIVSRYNQDFHLFSCLAKVANYTTRKESELTVRETLIKISDGYIHHHYLDNENFIFLYKSPIFRYDGDSFETQIGDIGFTFKRIEQQ
ncbi:hypothetical protein [Flavobacterium cerinum]|uniref:Uncharacterized protein n=1 Tax=Flavobacterium cerinum TaxID=2502784 RepID=A0ABY5ISZ7_9FLAO|nr:hypothetical protein [Flavobacterium cerinum]UUC45972.1 hypothetical protein NOX80_01925 [Flavobacterium cerinum]